MFYMCMLGNDFINVSILLLIFFLVIFLLLLSVHIYSIVLSVVFFLQDPLLIPDLLIRTRCIATSKIISCKWWYATLSFKCCMSVLFYSIRFCSFHYQTSSHSLGTIFVGMISAYTRFYIYLLYPLCTTCKHFKFITNISLLNIYCSFSLYFSDVYEQIN